MDDMTIKDFRDEWDNGEDTMIVHTSGSTGTPKPIRVEKQRMLASARMTCDFLGLKHGDTALLCMPLQFIAGKMMVVRAIERGLKLISVEPSSRPLKDLDESPTFAAMVPLQVYETLRHKHDRALFCQIRHTIIGGGALDEGLQDELRTLFPPTGTNSVWHSYGMTETLSHIALRNIHVDYFRPLSGITLSQDTNDCLVIDAPHLSADVLHTHDIVEMSDKGFRILGRLDNVICSGGIKIQIEEVESTLRRTLGDTVMVTSSADSKYGEAVVYLTTQPLCMSELESIVPNRYWLPKHIIETTSLPMTATGKPDRAAAKAIALQILKLKIEN